jgi:hypothetical protein
LFHCKKNLNFRISLAIILYLVIGILVKKFVYGSKGIDLIPNISFWTFLFSFGRTSKSNTESFGSVNSVEVNDNQENKAEEVNDNPFENKSTGAYGSI